MERVSVADAHVAATTVSARTAVSEIRALTGLRGLAAIFVVVFHEAGNFSGDGPAATFLRHGYNAVDLFFVLSGFVMALTYGEMWGGGHMAKL
jgi:peptidoglycan/LPS O-acetylase OafA/YrhL